MGKASHGINPVTIRGKDANKAPIGLTVARVHWGFGGIQNKNVSVVMYKDTESGEFTNSKDANNAILGFAILDEDHFLQGLYHLFPAGELAHAGDSAVPINTELVSTLKEAVNALRAATGDSDLVGRIDSVLRQVGG